MFIRSLCFCALGFAAPLAQASIQVESISCSGSLSLNDHNGISFDCGGDLSLSGGTVSAETGDLLINALGTLSLADIWLKASGIRLSGYNIFIAGNLNVETIDYIEITGSEVNYSPIIINAGANVAVGTIETASIEFLSFGRDMSLNGGLDASKGDRPALVASGIRTVSESVLNPYSGDILIFAPRGEINLLDIGIVGSNTPRGILKPFQGILSTVPIPIPAAFSQLLLGLCGLLTPALQRKKFAN